MPNILTKEAQEARIQAIEEARQATMAFAYLTEPVERLREDTIVRLVNAYRSHTATHDDLVGGIAEVSALDKLMKTLENTQIKGSVAAQKEFGNG